MKSPQDFGIIYLFMCVVLVLWKAKCRGKSKRDIFLNKAKFDRAWKNLDLWKVLKFCGIGDETGWSLGFLLIQTVLWL